ncbi:MAG TPA: hypothetical protein VD704_11210 [Gaiellaceae bacterium]|nr:hypothetical protein [Gaiellaceae bacterium]
MTGPDVRAALLAVQVPEELEAQRRSWRVVRAAHAGREPLRRRPRRARLLVALALLAALAAAALSPPGRAVGDWIRDRVEGKEPARPALVRLPAAGQLLVLSEEGPWLVRRDGSKRLLGRYDDAAFSPSARYVAVTDGHRLLAVDPQGTPRWQLARPRPVSDPRWSPAPGFRVAYREGGTLRLVAGDGTGDRLLAEPVAPVAPAWLPRPGATVLAYAHAAGGVRVVDTETGEQLWTAAPPSQPRKLVWSADGRFLLAVTAGGRHPLYRADGRVARLLRTPGGQELLDAELAGGEPSLAYAVYDPGLRRTAVVAGGRRLTTLDGRVEDLLPSPDGAWLLAAWPDADQLLFLPLEPGRGLVAVGDVRREFAPGAVRAAAFPELRGWCCAPAGQ